MNKSIILFFIIFASLIYSQLNSFQFDKITIDDGLSNNSINSILQTSDGYLWIATKDGLNRYDGKSFKVFKSVTNDNNSLPENYVMSLLESKNGNLWVGTWGGGICKFDPNFETFTRFDNRENKDDDYIQCLMEDDNNNIWFGTTDNGINCLSPNSKKIKVYNKTNSLPSNNIIWITSDSSKNLWIGTFNEGVIKFNPQTKKSIQYTKENTKGLIEDNSILSYYNDSKKYLWIGTFTGITKLDFNSLTFTKIPIILNENSQPTSAMISQIIKDHNNKFWFGTYDYKGLFINKFEDGNINFFTHIKKEVDNPNSLIADKIRWLYEDKQNNLWIGTEDGLNKLPATHPFMQFKYLPFRETSIGGRVVSSIIEGGSNILWVGYAGDGFDKINLTSSSIEHHNEGIDLNKPNKYKLSAYDVVTLFEDSENILWIGTSSGGLNRFDPISKTFKYYMVDSKNPKSIKSNWVQQIIETHDKKFLIGTNESLEVFNKEDESFSNYLPEIKSSSIKLPKIIAVNALFEDSKNNLWIGTWLDGLYQYDPKQREFFHYMPR